jgi:hypothetical protein
MFCGIVDIVLDWLGALVVLVAPVDLFLLLLLLHVLLLPLPPAAAELLFVAVELEETQDEDSLFGSSSTLLPARDNE